jgi:hypothetical protein
VNARTRFARGLGLLRSVLMYHGIPFRRRRLSQFYARFIRPGDLCFDIGAHVGSRLGAWLPLGARIVAVEPQPEVPQPVRPPVRRIAPPRRTRPAAPAPLPEDWLRTGSR